MTTHINNTNILTSYWYFNAHRSGFKISVKIYQILLLKIILNNGIVKYKKEGLTTYVIHPKYKFKMNIDVYSY